MRYPSRSDYQNAMCNLQVALVDCALAAGHVKRDLMGLPAVASGSFSTVFHVETAGREWAVRCFIGDIGDAAAIYAAVGAYLKSLQSPYFVGFEYEKDGIRVGSTTYPIVKMEWAAGEPLKSFIRQKRGLPAAIRTLADRWRRMLSDLTANRVAHGDLQHGNVLVRVDGAGPEVKLIDYDTVVVPALDGWAENNAGLPSYQHPRRHEVTSKHPAADAFSGAVIYASLAALARNPGIWDDLGMEHTEGLLFEPDDLANPDHARPFTVLRGLGGECEQLADALCEACVKKGPLEVPHLEEMLHAREWWKVAPPPQPGDEIKRLNRELATAQAAEAQLRQGSRARERAKRPRAARRRPRSTISRRRQAPGRWRRADSSRRSPQPMAIASRRR